VARRPSAHVALNALKLLHVLPSLQALLLGLAGQLIRPGGLVLGCLRLLVGLFGVLLGVLGALVGLLGLVLRLLTLLSRQVGLVLRVLRPGVGLAGFVLRLLGLLRQPLEPLLCCARTGRTRVAGRGDNTRRWRRRVGGGGAFVDRLTVRARPATRPGPPRGFLLSSLAIQQCLQDRACRAQGAGCQCSVGGWVALRQASGFSSR
jgi:hypothetical protein